MGGFNQIKLLKEGTIKEIQREADRILREGKTGGSYTLQLLTGFKKTP